MPSPLTANLYSVHGTEDTDVWAVGEGGAILHFDGASWTSVSSPTQKALRGVWGSSTTYFVAVGDENTALFWNGSTWAPSTITAWPPVNLRAVWGTGMDNIWVVGTGGTIFRYLGQGWHQSGGHPAVLNEVRGDGCAVWAVGILGTFYSSDQCKSSNWQGTNLGTSASLLATWGSLKDLFVAGEGGTVLHFDGVAWKAQTSGTVQPLWQLWGTSTTNLYAVGEKGTILRYDGTSWSAQNAGVSAHLYGLWGTPTRVFAVGAGGTILHRKP